MKMNKGRFQGKAIPFLISICLVASGAVHVNLFGSAYAQQIVEGYLYIYPSKEKRQYPKKDTAIVEFYLDPKNAISGPSEDEPDPKNGYWIGRFYIVDPVIKSGIITVEPRWVSDIGEYFSLRSVRVRVPIQTNIKVELHLYEADRFARKRATEADRVEKELRTIYGECLSMNANSERAECWNKLKNNDNVRFLLARAQTRYSRDLYRDAYRADPQNQYLFRWAKLEYSAGLFCDAADTFKLIDIEREMDRLIPSVYALVYGLEAAEQCVRESSGVARRQNAFQAMNFAKSSIDLPIFKLYPRPKMRFLSAWFRVILVLSNNPRDISAVARTLFQDKIFRPYWNDFRETAAPHVNLQFTAPEESHYTVAARIELFCRKLGEGC